LNCSIAAAPRFFLGFAYGNGFCWTQVYTDPTAGALDNIDNLRFPVFTLFKRTLRADPDADQACAGSAFGDIDVNWGFLLFAHTSQ
jgi:hypothetical protein